MSMNAGLMCCVVGISGLVWAMDKTGLGGDLVKDLLRFTIKYLEIKVNLGLTINDHIFTNMRVSGTKYESRELLPVDAIPVSTFYRKYGKKFGVSSPAYTYVKYDRHKFGYTTNAGTQSNTEYPGYDIIDFYGTCYVINYNS